MRSLSYREYNEYNALPSVSTMTSWSMRWSSPAELSLVPLWILFTTDSATISEGRAKVSTNSVWLWLLKIKRWRHDSRRFIFMIFDLWKWLLCSVIVTLYLLLGVRLLRRNMLLSFISIRVLLPLIEVTSIRNFLSLILAGLAGLSMHTTWNSLYERDVPQWEITLQPASL